MVQKDRRGTMALLQIPKKYVPKPNQTSIYIVGGKEYCVIHKEGKIFAIDNICPHQGASLALGELKGDDIICPLHQWKFNFKTGACSVERYCVEHYEVELVD